MSLVLTCLTRLRKWNKMAPYLLYYAATDEMLRIWLAVAIASLLGTALPARAQGLATLHSFTNVPDGANPLQLFGQCLVYGSTAMVAPRTTALSLHSIRTAGASRRLQFHGAAGSGSAPNNLLVTSNRFMAPQLLRNEQSGDDLCGQPRRTASPRFTV